MKERVRIGVLLAVVALAYGNTLLNQFVMDDELYIMRNPQVTAPSLKGILSPNSVSGVYRPLSFASLAINWDLSGPLPFPYHLFNLFLHAGVTLLFYLLLLRLLQCFSEGEGIAFAAALIFAVHPIHTEAVSWVVGRAELLAAGFLFAGWLFHLRDRPAESLICFTLALLSKESAIAFLPLVLIGDYVLGQWKPRYRYALITGLAILYLGALWKAQGGRFGSAGISVIDNPLAGLSAGWRILNASRVAWKYVALQIYPAALSCDYSFNQISVFRDLRHNLLAALAALAVVGIWGLALWKRKAGVALAGGIYLAGFAATANLLIPTGTIFGERLAYLPSAGFCLFVALCWNWFRKRRISLAWGVLAALVLAFTVRTVQRNRDWKDNFALYSSGVKAVPNNAKMHSNLAGEYLNRNELDLAAREYQTALQINPDFPDGLAFASMLELRRGDYQTAGAMMEKALHMTDRSNPNYDWMVVNFAAILIKTNHADGALQLLNQEITEKPAYSPAWLRRAELHYKQGEVQAAQADAKMAVQLDPADAEAQQILAAMETPASSQ